MHQNSEFWNRTEQSTIMAIARVQLEREVTRAVVDELRRSGIQVHEDSSSDDERLALIILCNFRSMWRESVAMFNRT